MIVSSGDLVQRFEAAWTPAQLATHVRASAALYRIKDRAFDRARRALKDGERLTEFDLQQQMVQWFEEEGLVSDSAPDVALGANAGNPHYLPTPRHHAWGGYETWPARSSYLEVDAAPKIRDGMLDLLASLSR